MTPREGVSTSLPTQPTPVDTHRRAHRSGKGNAGTAKQVFEAGGMCCPLLVLSLHLSPQRRETPLQQGSWESFTNCPLSPGHTLLNQSVHSFNLLSQSSKRRLENRASWKENDPQIRCYSYTRTNSQIALQSPGVPLQQLQRRVNPRT